MNELIPGRVERLRRLLSAGDWLMVVEFLDTMNGPAAAVYFVAACGKDINARWAAEKLNDAR